MDWKATHAHQRTEMKAVLQQCFAKGKGISAEAAEEKIESMYIRGRYNVESW